ncbi:MAG TPA: glycosyltransferase family 2 protein [Dyadobacter sp.]|jgi:glycosyltransferase involved in cell wall biosynthesis|nr:glycosyltransferase family 2 protein [Dyadobacter sp.]
MPLLTIVTITYNAEKYLERTLSSVQHALSLFDPESLEYLIIDGGSKDKTLDIAGRYGFISKIVSERDNGLYDAMNKGLRLAKGDYIWFLNAGDEVYDQEVLQKLGKQLIKKPDICYSDAMFVREDGNEVGLRSKFTPHNLPTNLTWQDFKFGMKVCHQAFIVKTSLAPAYDITNLSADIDWEINCLKKADTVTLLNFILCKYLLGGTSVQNHKRSLTDRFKVLQKHFGFAPTLFNHFFIFWRGYRFAKKNGKYW